MTQQAGQVGSQGGRRTRKACGWCSKELTCALVTDESEEDAESDD